MKKIAIVICLAIAVLTFTRSSLNHVSTPKNEGYADASNAGRLPIMDLKRMTVEKANYSRLRYDPNKGWSLDAKTE